MPGAASGLSYWRGRLSSSSWNASRSLPPPPTRLPYSDGHASLAYGTKAAQDLARAPLRAKIPAPQAHQWFPWRMTSY